MRSEERIPLSVPRGDSQYYAESIPKSNVTPVPTGWYEQQTAAAASQYEQSNSVERMLNAHDSMRWGEHTLSVREHLGRASTSAELISGLPSLWIEEQRWRSRAMSRESERLATMMRSAPRAARGQHVTQRVLPAVHPHFTTARTGLVKYHRNLHLPLDQPHDLQPMVPRAWKLESSSSSPALARLAHKRKEKARRPRTDIDPLGDDDLDGLSPPGRTSAEKAAAARAARRVAAEEDAPFRERSLQDEEDAAAAVAARAILAELTASTTPAELPPAPIGMSGLPSSVPLRKVWSYSDPRRRPPPMAFFDAKGELRRMGDHA